jgi:hypothetical protein
MDGPTYFSSDILIQEQAEFPAMTVCPLTNQYKLDVLQANGIEEKDRYNYKTNLTWSSNNSNVVTESELFLNLTYNLDELVKRITIRFNRAVKKFITVILA